MLEDDTTLKVFAQISKKKHILLLGNESSMNQKTHLQLVRIIEAVKEWVGSILGIQWRDLTRVSSWWTSYQNIGQNPRVSLTIQSPHQDQKKIQVAFSSSKPKTFDICFHHFHHCRWRFLHKFEPFKNRIFFSVQMNCCLKYAWLTSLWQCDHMLLSGRHWSSDSCGFFKRTYLRFLVETCDLLIQNILEFHSKYFFKSFWS